MRSVHKLRNRIREFRKQKGKTLDQIQDETGIKRGTLNNYENGKTEPKLETWKKLADYFGVSVGYLQGIEEKSQIDAGRQQRWHERERSFLKALRESYMLDGSWEDLVQTFKREWDAHELEERRVQGNGHDDTR